MFLSLSGFSIKRLRDGGYVRERQTSCRRRILSSLIWMFAVVMMSYLSRGDEVMVEG